MSQCGEALVGREGRGCRANIGGPILEDAEELAEDTVRGHRVTRVGGRVSNIARRETWIY